MFSVVTPAVNKQLTTLANVKTELGITGGAEDAKINRLIDRISAMVCDHLEVPAAADGSKTLGLETLDHTFLRSPWYRGNAGMELILARHPVTEIVSIKVGDTEIDLEDTELDGAAGILRRLGTASTPSFSGSGLRTVVRFKAGWTMPDVVNFTLPLPLEGSVIGMIRAARFAADRDPMVKSEWTTDIERIDYWVGQIGQSGAFPPDIADSLAHYRYEIPFG